RRLFQEIQDVFLRQLEQRATAFLGAVVLLRRRPFWDRAPEVIEGLLVVLAALAFAFLLHAQVGRAAARVAVHAVAHQRVGRVQQGFDRLLAVAFLAA